MNLFDELGAAIADEWEKDGFKYLYDPEGSHGYLSFIRGPASGRIEMAMIQHGIPLVVTETARTPGTQAWEDRVRQKFDAAMATLKMATHEQERFIEVVREVRSDIPESGRNAAYILPANQTDRTILRKFLEVLSQHEIIFYHTTIPYPSYVIPFRQPCIQVAHTLFSNGDLSAEILSPDYGLEVYSLDERSSEEQEAFARSPLRRTSGILDSSRLKVLGNGKGKLAFSNSYSGIILANRLLKAGYSVSRLREAVEQAPYTLLAGAYVVNNDLLDVLKNLVGSLDLDLIKLERAQAKTTEPITIPRIGLYAGEGIGYLNIAHLADIWWALDALEFPFVRIDREELMEGMLDKIDLLIVPGGDGQEMIDGLNPDTPWYKAPWQPPIPTGRGMGSKGVRIIKEFVQNGNKYLGIGMGGGLFASKDLSGLMDITTVESPLGSGIVYLSAEDVTHPLLAGWAGVTQRNGTALSNRMAAYFYCPPSYFKEAGTSPLFVGGRNAQVIAAFEDSLAPDSRSEETKAIYVGKGAIVTQRIGKGVATVVGVNIGFRASWFSTYPFLANVIYG